MSMLHFKTGIYAGNLVLKMRALFLLVPLLQSCAGRSLLAPNNPLVSAGKTGIGSSLVDVSQFRAWRHYYECHEGTAVYGESTRPKEPRRALFSQQQPDPYVQTPLVPEATDQSHVAGQLISGTRDEAKAKIFRNKIIHELLVIDDDFFILWSQRLHGTNAIGSSLTDFSAALLGAFAAASGASSAKSLGLAVTGIMSGRMAIKEHIFLKEQASALISTMEEDRARISTQIDQYLKKDINEYPLEYALRDVLRYYQAGTLASASMSLANSAGERAREAEAINEFQKGDRLESRAYLEKVLDPQKKMVLKLAPTVSAEQGAANRAKAVALESVDDLEIAINKLMALIPSMERTDTFYGDIMHGLNVERPMSTREDFATNLPLITKREYMVSIRDRTRAKVHSTIKADINTKADQRHSTWLNDEEYYKALLEGFPSMDGVKSKPKADVKAFLLNESTLTTDELVEMRKRADNFVRDKPAAP